MKRRFITNIIAGSSLLFLMSAPVFAAGIQMGGKTTMTPGMTNPAMGTKITLPATMTPGTHNPVMGTTGTTPASMTPGTHSPVMGTKIGTN